MKAIRFTVILAMLLGSMIWTAPGNAQGVDPGSGVIVNVFDDCSGMTVIVKVDRNVGYYLRLIHRSSGEIFGEASGTSNQDRFIEQSVRVDYSRVFEPTATLWVELFLGSERGSPVSAFDKALTCTTPGVRPENGIRLTRSPDFVVFLKDDKSLEYYEVINSKGFYIGFTPPGWRNDRLGRQVIHVVTRADGARAELWHQQDDIYYVDVYRGGGSLIGSSTFSAAGIPGGQNFVYVAAPAIPVTTTYTTVATSYRRDNGPQFRAQGGFDGTFYTVARGDNLYRISLRFNTTVAALQAANGIPDARRIEVGQRLRIP